MKCFRCGKNNNDNDLYCNYCGNNLKTQDRNDNSMTEVPADLEPPKKITIQGNVDVSSYRWVLYLIVAFLLISFNFALIPFCIVGLIVTPKSEVRIRKFIKKILILLIILLIGVAAAEFCVMTLNSAEKNHINNYEDVDDTNKGANFNVSEIAGTYVCQNDNNIVFLYLDKDYNYGLNTRDNEDVIDTYRVDKITNSASSSYGYYRLRLNNYDDYASIIKKTDGGITLTLKDVDYTCQYGV